MSFTARPTRPTHHSTAPESRPISPPHSLSSRATPPTLNLPPRTSHPAPPTLHLPPRTSHPAPPTEDRFGTLFAELGYTSCWGDVPPVNNYTTYNARTFLQPQLQKASKFAERAKKGDVNPKNFILFPKGAFSVSLACNIYMCVCVLVYV